MNVRLHAATDDLDVVMKCLTASAAYFAMVFGAGFVFGTVRVMWLLAVIVVAARSVNRRFLSGRDRYSRLIVGVMALVLLLLAELILGVMFMGLTPTDDSALNQHQSDQNRRPLVVAQPSHDGKRDDAAGKKEPHDGVQKLDLNQTCHQRPLNVMSTRLNSP